MPRWPKGSTNNVPKGSSVGRATEMGSAETSVDAESKPAPSTEGLRAENVLITHYDKDPMIIKFETVTLHYEIPRPRVVQGLATQGTAFFDTKQPTLRGYFIDLDTSTQLLRIGIDNVSVRLPIAAVKYFGLTLDEAEALAEAKAAAAKATKLANEKAAAEAEALAAQPA